MLRLATQVTTSPTAWAPELVGHLGHRPHLGAPGPEEGDDLVLADLLAEGDPGQDFGHGAPAGGGAARAGAAGPGGSGARPSRPEHQMWSRARPSASEWSRTRKRMAGSSQRPGSRANSG